MKAAFVGVLVGCVVAALPADGASQPTLRRGDAKSYKLLGETKHLPRLDAGDADRVLGYPRPVHARQPHDSALDVSEVRRPIVDATCDADLVVIAQVASATPFQHPNGRWILTAHDLDVSHVARAKDGTLRDVTRVRYVHPSGRDTIAGRRVTTTVERYPTLVVGDELLFFLVRIGPKTAAYRASLESPPLAVRGGLLYDIAPHAADSGPSIDGTSAREALRVVNAAICRPARGRSSTPGIHTTPFPPPGSATGPP